MANKKTPKAKKVNTAKKKLNLFKNRKVSL